MKQLMLCTLGGAVCALLAAASTVPAAWPAETLSGKISMVRPDRKLLVVRDRYGVPFDLDITAKTRILLDGKTVPFEDLKQDKNREASIHFVPEDRGDVALSIRVNG